MASQILSIDLQDDLLTAVLLKNDINKDIIASTAVINQNKTVEEIISELTSTLDCRDCRCLLSLGASFFSFRNLTLPFSDSKSIDKILPFELEENSAEAIETMLIDTMVNTQDNETDSEVITAMIKHDVLAEYYTALKQAAIAPEFITLSGLPTISEIQETGQAPEEFIFLDLRLESTTLFLISSGKLQLVRHLPFSPLPFESSPKAEFKIDEKNGTLQVQGLENSGESYYEFALAVKQTLAPLPLTTTWEQIPIYIDGTAGTSKGVSSWLEAKDAFARPCLICGRAGLLPLPIQLPEETKAHAAFLMACLSLGKQADKPKNIFNFSKDEFASQRNLLEFRNMAKMGSLALIAIIILSLGYLWYDTTTLKKKRTTLVAEIHEIFKKAQPDVKRIVAPVQQLQVAVDNAKNSTDDGGENILPRTVLHILRELSTRIPTSMDVRINRLVYESKGLRLMGITDSFNTVDSMKKKLEQSPDFSAVTISSTKQAAKDNKIRFELKIDVGAGAQ